MSLDVWLTVKETVRQEQKIYIRENGQNKAISITEWNERYPDKTAVMPKQVITNEVFEWNITHNLNKMATEAGIYNYLWRPDEINISQAHKLIEPLETGLRLLREKPEYFREFNPSNGWGNYEGLLAFVESYLQACIEYPHAEIGISR